MKKSSYAGKGKTVKKIIAVVCAAAVLAGGAFFYFRKGEKQTEQVNTATAARGNIRVVVSGSAALEAIDSYEVKATVAGDVLSCSFNEGDKVRKDQVLYTIDATDMQNTLERAELAMEKSRDAYNSTQKELSKLTIKTPINGVITNMYIKEGDNVSNGTKICDIIDTSKMILTIPFNLADVDSIYNGQTAEVTLDNSFYTTTGVVTRVATGSIANENNVSIVFVDIEVENPGGIKKGDSATAVIGDIACNSSGTFDAKAEQTVTSEINGRVVGIYNDVGDMLYAGSTVASLSSDNLNDSLKSQRLNLRDAELSLKNTYDRLDNYTIKAPISGTVIYKNVKAGDTLDNTASAPTMCYIADLSTIVFSLSVDELDISKIEVGQRVEIDADAVEGRQYGGFVKTVSINGTTVNGVTTYPVEVEVSDPDGLIPGMNVNADIIIEEKTDVLTVPVSAVFRGNYCYVKDDESSAGKSGKDRKTESGSDAEGKGGFKKDGSAPDGGQGSFGQDGQGSGAKTAPNAPPTGNFGKTDGSAQFGNNGGSGKENAAQGAEKGAAPGGEKSGGTEKDDAGKNTGKSGESEKGKESGSAGKGFGAGGSQGGVIPGSGKSGISGGSNKDGQSGDANRSGFAGMIPEGFHAVKVTTGANDDNFIEITAGLSEGDVVYVKSLSGTTTNPFMQGMPGGGMGGGSWGGQNGARSGGTGSWGGQSGARSGGTGSWGGQSGGGSWGGQGGTRSGGTGSGSFGGGMR